MPIKFHILTIVEFVVAHRMVYVLLLAIFAIGLMYLQAWLDRRNMSLVEIYREEE